MGTIYQLVVFNPDTWAPSVVDDVTCNPLFEALYRAQHAAQSFEKTAGGEDRVRTLAWVTDVAANGLVVHRAEGAGNTAYLIFESSLF
jgi:hypothetical protein